MEPDRLVTASRTSVSCWFTGESVDRRAGYPWRFTDRHGGVSAAPYATLNLGGGVGDDPAAVAANRATVAAERGCAAERLVFMRQVALRGWCTPCVAGESVPIRRVDGIVTGRARHRRWRCWSPTACPILARDPIAGVIAAAHAGRIGAAAGIALATHRGDGRAWAPRRTASGSCSDRRSAALLRGARRRCATRWTPTCPGRPARHPGARRLSISGRGIARQLEAAGRCARVGRRTVHHREIQRLFTHRRDGLTGRFAGVIWRPALAG